MKKLTAMLLIMISVALVTGTLNNVPVVHAATVTVTNLNDGGAGSLRQAIADASPGDTVNFSVTGTITLTSGELVIGKDLNIDGPGADQLSVSGNLASRVFNITGGTVTIRGLTVKQGSSPGDGGGIFNSGILNLIDITLNNNRAPNFCGLGGGIFNAGTLNITDSVFNNNTAADAGGGILSDFGGILTVANSTFSHNVGGSNCLGVFGSGGGIYNRSGGILDVTDSTFDNNSTVDDGGGVRNDGTLTVTNSTFSNNSAVDAGGGIYSPSSAEVATLTNTTITDNTAARGGGIFGSPDTVELVNTIIAGNTAVSSSPDCSGSPTSMGHNLIGDATSCSFVATTGDQVGTGGSPINPLLGPLDNNGGPTLTHALLMGSPAIDAANNALCPGADQRGIARPLGRVCDIGAYEFGDADGDGIRDEVDGGIFLSLSPPYDQFIDQSKVFSNNFADRPGMGTTSGIIFDSLGVMRDPPFIPADEKNFCVGRNDCNKNAANTVIDSIVVHHCGASFQSCVNTFASPPNPDSNPPKLPVSAHYVISSKGQIVQMVRDENRAFHATYYNDRSIGIELEGSSQLGDLTLAMYESLANLIAQLAKEHNILLAIDPTVEAKEDNCLDVAGIVGHRQVQPAGINGECKEVTDSDKDGTTGEPHEFFGKTDPGDLFDWNLLKSFVKARAVDLGAGPVLTVKDLTDPKGVLIEASGGFGSQSSVIPSCNSFTPAVPFGVIRFSNGDSVELTCTSLTAEVLSGPVEILLTRDIIINVPSATIVIITEVSMGVLGIENSVDSEGTILIQLQGQEILIVPGETVTIVAEDTTPPLCEVIGVNIAHPAPPSNILVHVQDLGSGLSNVNILTQENVGNVTFTPAITSGTTELIAIVADKADESSQARFQIEVFDLAGNRSECDPLLAELDRSPSSPRYSTYEAIPQQDRYFTISNTGESILTYALVNVNGRWFVMPTLLPYEIKTIDIGSALVAGEKNTITVWGGGHGSSVMMSDVMPAMTNTFAYPDEPLY